MQIIRDKEADTSKQKKNKDEEDKMSPFRLTEHPLDKKIIRLPFEERLTFILHDIEGYSKEEVADIIGMPVSQAKKHLFNARRIIIENEI